MKSNWNFWEKITSLVQEKYQKQETHFVCVLQKSDGGYIWICIQMFSDTLTKNSSLKSKILDNFVNRLKNYCHTQL